MYIATSVKCFIVQEIFWWTLELIKCFKDSTGKFFKPVLVAQVDILEIERHFTTLFYINCRQSSAHSKLIFFFIANEYSCALFRYKKVRLGVPIFLKKDKIKIKLNYIGMFQGYNELSISRWNFFMEIICVLPADYNQKSRMIW